MAPLDAELLARYDTLHGTTCYYMPGGPMLSHAQREELDSKLRAVFKPTTPINSFDLFCGRQNESRSLVAAVNQNGQHAILFGERGVGKTSLANILFFLVDSPGWPR